jgi:hypothetical protein
MIVLMAGLLALSCGSNDCDDAIDKLSECNLGADYANVDFDNDSCDGRTQCIADCINGSSCAEIVAAEATSTYRVCIAACG